MGSLHLGILMLISLDYESQLTIREKITAFEEGNVYEA